MGCAGSKYENKEAINEYKIILTTLKRFKEIDGQQLYRNQNKFSQNYMINSKSSILNTVQIRNDSTFNDVIKSIEKAVVDDIKATVDQLSLLTDTIVKKIIQKVPKINELKQYEQLAGKLACINEVKQCVESMVLNNLNHIIISTKTLNYIKYLPKYSFKEIINRKDFHYIFYNERRVIESQSSLRTDKHLNQSNESSEDYYQNDENESASELLSKTNALINDHPMKMDYIMINDNQSDINSHLLESTEYLKTLDLEKKDFILLFNKHSSTIHRIIPTKGTQLERFLLDYIDSLEQEKTLDDELKKLKHEKKKLEKELEMYEKHIISLNEQMNTMQTNHEKEKEEMNHEISILQKQLIKKDDDNERKIQSIEQQYLKIQQKDSLQMKEMQQKINSLEQMFQTQQTYISLIFKKKYEELMKSHCPKNVNFKLMKIHNRIYECFTVKSKHIKQNQLKLPRIIQIPNDDIDVEMYTIKISQKCIEDEYYVNETCGSNYFTIVYPVYITITDDSDDDSETDSDDNSQNDNNEYHIQHNESKIEENNETNHQEEIQQQNEEVNETNYQQQQQRETNEIKENQIVEQLIPIALALQGGNISFTINNNTFSLTIKPGTEENTEYCCEGYGINSMNQQCDLIVKIKYNGEGLYYREGNDLIGVFTYSSKDYNQIISLPYPVPNVINHQIYINNTDLTLPGYGFRNGDIIGDYKVLIRLVETEN